MEPLYIFIAILAGLNVIAVLLILVDDFYYLGAEKILPIIFTLVFPLFGALIMISKLGYEGDNSGTRGDNCDPCTYEFFNGSDSGGGGGF